MLSAMRVAEFLIAISKIVNGEKMTNMRLNKLLYFCQALHLKRYNTPLFMDDFEAWDYGPVIPNIYREFKRYGGQEIEEGGNLEVGASDAERQTIIDAMRKYNKYTTNTLVDMTHQPGLPWDLANRKKEKVISKNDIKEYFNDEVATTEEIVDSLAIEGYRDENNHLVLKNREA